MKITTEALRMLSAEQAVFPDAQDALDRLAFLVGPILLPLGVEQQITGEKLKDIIEGSFGLELPTEVAQTLLFRLAKRDYVTQTRVDESSVFFGIGAEKIESPKAVQELTKDFRLFIKDKALLPKISDDEILNLFMEIVFELDELSDNNETRGGETKSIEEWKKSLISDYVLTKSDTDGRLPPLLSKLAELCLLRSVVGNLTEQKVRTAKSTMVALLDAPLALYAIGASGSKQKASVQATLAAAKDIGIKVCILPVSFKEMTRVLNGVLSADHVNRRGPTAAAIRAQEVSETIVEDMRKTPEKYTKSEGISTLSRTIESYPSEFEFFDESRYDEFSAIASRWAKTDKGAHHDAEALTVVMRARRSKHERSIFYNSHVFITGNWIFSTSSNKYCLERLATNPNVTPPVVHFSFFSASVWIATGFPSISMLPEKTLLAACERTLNGQSDVISKAAKLFEDFKITDNNHLQAYLQDRDCVNSIVKETYNDPSLIDESNIAKLFEKMREAAAGELLEKAKSEKAELISKFDSERNEMEKRNREEIAAVEEEGKRERERMEGSIDQLDETVSQLHEKFQHREIQQRDNIRNRVEDLNRAIMKRNLIDFMEFSFFTLASLLVCFQVSLGWGVGAFIFGYAFVACSYFERWYPYRAKKAIMRWHCLSRARSEFSSFEISEWQITLNDDFQFEVGKEG